FSGTATPGAANDFTNTTTSVTIAAGNTTATITVPTTDDSLIEANGETVRVTLGAIAGDPQITRGTSAATGTINDNDSATLSISGTPTVTEGSALTFTVMLSAASSTATTVAYSFNGSTATPGAANDFTNTTTRVTIPAGSTTATIAVPTSNDSLLEANGETVIVTLGAITGDPDITLAATSSATGTINDNDGATLSI